MGMFDNVVVLDETLCCPHGHRIEGFQTKSFDDPAHWLLEGNEAVFQRRHAVEPIVPPREILFYTSCDECAPVLVRCEHARTWGDLIDERQLWVEFRARFESDGLRHIERTSGTRDDLVTELREDGLRVMRDDEPLAIAHCEIRAARAAMPYRRSRSRR